MSKEKQREVLFEQLKSNGQRQYPEDGDSNITLKKFGVWIRANPHIIKDVRGYVYMAIIIEGKKVVSVRDIAGSLRQSPITKPTTGDEFKIGNNWTPLIARLLLLNDNNLDGFIDLNVPTSTKEKPSSTIVPFPRKKYE
jgi:hypothetical protein